VLFSGRSIALRTKLLLSPIQHSCVLAFSLLVIAPAPYQLPATVIKAFRIGKVDDFQTSGFWRKPKPDDKMIAARTKVTLPIKRIMGAAIQPHWTSMKVSCWYTSPWSVGLEEPSAEVLEVLLYLLLILRTKSGQSCSQDE